MMFWNLASQLRKPIQDGLLSKGFGFLASEEHLYLESGCTPWVLRAISSCGPSNDRKVEDGATDQSGKVLDPLTSGLVLRTPDVCSAGTDGGATDCKFIEAVERQLHAGNIAVRQAGPTADLLPQRE